MHLFLVELLSVKQFYCTPLNFPSFFMLLRARSQLIRQEGEKVNKIKPKASVDVHGTWKPYACMHCLFKPRPVFSTGNLEEWKACV